MYPSLTEYTSFFRNYVRPSQNLPLPPRIYPLFQQLCETLPESTPPSQNIPPFSTTICDPPRIYSSLLKYTTVFNNYMRCDPPRIHPSLSEYTPLFNQFICANLPESTPPSQNIPPFQELYPTLPESTPPSQNLLPPFKTVCDPHRIYPSLLEYTPLFNNYKIMRSSQSLPLPPSIFFSSGSEGLILSQLHVVSRKGDIFSDLGVDSWNIAYI